LPFTILSSSFAIGRKQSELSTFAANLQERAVAFDSFQRQSLSNNLKTLESVSINNPGTVHTIANYKKIFSTYNNRGRKLALPKSTSGKFYRIGIYITRTENYINIAFICD
jgi:hypothetical protein